MIIDVLSGPPGCGKSTALRSDALGTPGLYLFAMPTIALIREQAEAFRNESAAQGISLDVTEADSGARGQGSGSVQKRLDGAVSRIVSGGIQHAIVLITHDSLMGSDLSGLGGWHVRIDENPTATQGAEVTVAASVGLLANVFDLKPVVGSDWSEVKLKIARPNWRDLQDDNLFGSLTELVKQASRDHGVFVNTHKLKKSFGWFSVWLPDALRHFATCKIAGASYLTSLGAVIAQRWLPNDITWNPITLKMIRSGHPTIKLHYFTRSHEGTTKLWERSEGRYCIARICDFLHDRETELGFWSGNEEVRKLMEWRLHGKPILPKVAGLNEYRDRTSCAMIYSSKPTKNDRPLQEVFGLSDDDVRRAREDEDIIQFVMRGSIRNADYDGDYDIYVYSKRQAETLERQLAASGVGKSVILAPEDDAGIMDYDPDPGKTARKAISASKAEDRKQKDKERKRAARSKKAEAGGREPGKSGRPEKNP